MKVSQKDPATQLKDALILPALLVIITGAFGVYAATDFVWKVACGVLAVVAACSILVVMIVIPKQIAEKIHWLTNMLDAIPYPISATDKDMNWTFINKPVEDMLKTTRAQAIGKQCSNWNAGICNTEQCGITCLKKNIIQTTFEQMGATFQVDTAYLRDVGGNIIGHIEVVQDISKLNSMKQLEALLNQIEQICPVLSSGAEQVASSSQALAQGATEQAAAVEQLAASVNTISDQVNDNAKNAQKANTMAAKATASIESSNQQMEIGRAHV